LTASGAFEKQLESDGMSAGYWCSRLVWEPNPDRCGKRPKARRWILTLRWTSVLRTTTDLQKLDVEAVRQVEQEGEDEA
jgi:hypothetical protein